LTEKWLLCAKLCERLKVSDFTVTAVLRRQAAAAVSVETYCYVSVGSTARRFGSHWRM